MGSGFSRLFRRVGISKLRALLAALILSCALLALLGADQAKSSAPAGNSSAGTPEAAVPYKLPFGPNPFLPSQAKADFQGFLKPSDFPSAEYCGKCHEDVHKE